ncbi:MAG: lamin tail domain-containing protein, partial [Patescibacteria group bacterium]|nr:lamin tail domain-containing protein [Patescibacteria group bacterium]
MPAALAASPGDVVITEIMVNPSGTESNTEWFEVQNNSVSAIDITNWKVNTGANHNISGGYPIPIGARAVICRNSDTTLNGGVNCNYTAAAGFSNTGDTVILYDDADNEIASTTYAGTDVQAGKSIQVSSDGALSAETTNQFGSGDFGTPAGNTVSIGNHSYPTTQQAVTAALDGDTIDAAAGTYAENVSIDGKTNLTIQGAGDTTIVEPASGIGFAIKNSSGITIKNLKIHTTGTDAHGIWVAGTPNGGATAVTGLTVQDDTIVVDGYSSGIYAERVDTAPHSGWLIGGVGHGNTITINPGTGVTGDGLDLHDVSNSEVSYNTITLNTPTDSTNVLWTSELSDLSTLVFSNNTVSGSSGSEIAFLTNFVIPGDTSIAGITISG